MTTMTTENTHKLVYWPAGILKRVSEPLTAAPDPQLIADMKKTMTAHNGAGLSAIQIGVAQRIFLVGEKVFVNPVFISKSDEKVLRHEGCLSVPGFFENVLRHQHVFVSYRDENFELHENERFDGLQAHVLQHESEHLDGKLFLDYLPSARKSQIMGNIQAMKRAGKLK